MDEELDKMLESLGIDSQRHFCVYLLVHREKDDGFYIGATGRCPRTRLKAHLTIARTGGGSSVCKKIRTILAAGENVDVRVLVENLTEGEAAMAEQRWIHAFGLDNLCNVLVWDKNPDYANTRQTRNGRVRVPVWTESNKPDIAATVKHAGKTRVPGLTQRKV